MAKPKKFKFKNKQAYWRYIFKRVITYYQEAKETQGTLSCTPFYKKMSDMGMLRRQWNTKVVHPTIADFLCDVELVAKKVLSKHEFKFFVLVYLKQDKQTLKMLTAKKPSFKTITMDINIQEKVGFAFLKFKLHPIEVYLMPKDLR